MPISDPWGALHHARRRYAEALMRRRRFAPGEPGYHEAVHEVGVAWALVRRWERVVRQQRPGDPGEA